MMCPKGRLGQMGKKGKKCLAVFPVRVAAFGAT